MTNKEKIISLLGKYGNDKLTSELTELYYEVYPNYIDERRRDYISRGVDKTEKELFNQIGAEISSVIITYGRDLISTDRSSNKRRFSLTDKGLEFYNELISNKTEDILPMEEISKDDEIELQSDNKGIVYLLVSSTYPDTYKIGITISLEERLINLSRDFRYGVFDLKPKMYFKCNDYQLIEQVLHKFFEDFRLGKKNDLSVDTELFKDNPTIEEEFEAFVEFLQKNPRHKVEQLIKL